jgi:hypothetical protein
VLVEKAITPLYEDLVMRMATSLLTLALVLGAPAGACAQTRHSTQSAAVVHQFTTATTLIEHGDTLTWIHRRSMSPALTARDTVVYLLWPDSALRLRPKGPTVLTPEFAHQLRELLKMAKKQEEVSALLGRKMN